MRYNNLGKSGLKISELSFGSWLTFGASVDVPLARQLIRLAFDSGVNFFDNAEVYAEGRSEEVMGEVLREYRRQDLVVSTKIFWGGNGPNDKGLSWKHLVEGTNASLKRLQMEYVDLLFCHRPDPSTPIEETVRAMDHIIQQGKAFYWGTSEWSAQEIESAFKIAKENNCVAPTMEQPQYNMLVRDRFEREYASLFERFKLGTTIWSPLASGILTGKYNNGIAAGTRLDRTAWLREKLTPDVIDIVRKLEELSKSLECSLSQLAIAWCLKNPNVSTVIFGATSTRQLQENLSASQIVDKLSTQVLAQIDKILQNNK